MRLKHFQNSPSFKKLQGLGNTKFLNFCNMLISQKLKCRAEKKYIITDGMRRDVFLLQEKK